MSVMHQTMGPVSFVMRLMERAIWMITSGEVAVDKDEEDEDDKSTGCPGQAWGRPNGVAIPSSNLCNVEHTCYNLHLITST